MGITALSSLTLQGLQVIRIYKNLEQHIGSHGVPWKQHHLEKQQRYPRRGMAPGKEAGPYGLRKSESHQVKMKEITRAYNFTMFTICQVLF